jgi:capsid protein
MRSPSAIVQRSANAEQVDAEIAADKAREQKLGLVFGSAQSAQPEQPEGNETDAPSQPDDNATE